MAAPSYSVSATDTTVTFTVVPASGYTYYRLFLRLSSSTAMIVDGLGFTATSAFSYTVSGLSPETEYTVNVRYGTSSANYEGYTIGAQTVTTKASSGGSRPSDWSWATIIATGASVPTYGNSLAPVSASEWNAFCDRINEFRAHKNLSAYPFTTVSRGTSVTSAILKQAVTAISAISGHGTLPTVYNVTSASFWQGLAAALNSIT